MFYQPVAKIIIKVWKLQEHLSTVILDFSKLPVFFYIFLSFVFSCMLLQWSIPVHFA
jgi:hypothetical protein